MTQNPIEEVSVHEDGSLRLRPADGDFEYVYRAATGVRWDPETRELVAPPPREWTYVDWFRQIVRAVNEEFGQTLAITSATRWTNVAPEIREELLRGLTRNA